MSDSERLPDDIIGSLPVLRHGRYQVTSDDDPNYNCVAFSIGVSDEWIAPYPPDCYHWFPDLGEGSPVSIDLYRRFYLRHGYEICEDDHPEAGYAKIALYSDADGFRHVAVEVEPGVWKSKLGSSHDVSHRPADLEGEDGYGRIVVYMRRARKA